MDEQLERHRGGRSQWRWDQVLLIPSTFVRQLLVRNTWESLSKFGHKKSSNLLGSWTQLETYIHGLSSLLPLNWCIQLWQGRASWVHVFWQSKECTAGKIIWEHNVFPISKSRNTFLLHVSVDHGTSTFYPNIAIQISKLVDNMFKKTPPSRIEKRILGTYYARFKMLC